MCIPVPKRPNLSVQLLIAATLLMSWTTQAAAPYQESGGRVVIEAEHFSTRSTDTAGTPEVVDDHHWHIVPDDDGTDPFGDSGDPIFISARGDKYIQSLPDSGQIKNEVVDVGTAPYLDYLVQVNTPGQYRLWLRWGGHSGDSDTIYAEVRELKDSMGGKISDWYHYVSNIGADFAIAGPDGTGWHGEAGFEDVFGTILGTPVEKVPAVWDISAAGVYTIRLTMREDGSAVDALIFQLASLPDPTDPGPAESAAATVFVIITGQPDDSTAAPGQTASFTVMGEGSSSLTYQWQNAMRGTANFTDIAGATGTSYTTATLTETDNQTKYRAVVSIPGRTVQSREATLTVTVAPFRVIKAAGSDTLNRATVSFSKPANVSFGTNLANYAISGLTISNVKLAAGGTNVILTTSQQTTGAVYTVTVKDVTDRATPANTLSPNPTQVNFTGWVLTNGVALHKYFNNFKANNIMALTNDPRFPDNPTFTTYQPRLEYPPNAGELGGADYGDELTAFLIPPITGDYVFYCAGDEPVEVYLSTDENPGNKHLICAEPEWNSGRDWVGTTRRNPDAPENRSNTYLDTQWPQKDPATGAAQITLEKGKRYYIQVLHTAIGPDDLYGAVGVTWQLPGEPEPVNGSAAMPELGTQPISGEFMAAFVNPDLVPPPARLIVARQGMEIVVSWTASGFRLEQADQVTGPWAALTGQASPFTATPSGAAKFYRLRRQ
ncbi:MAG: hypothetical protein L0Z50_17740 [Verrucomicrobiales bacterium]|nr:hypothetical protein [Verrucomicrobiales bacterium]